MIWTDKFKFDMTDQIRHTDTMDNASGFMRWHFLRFCGYFCTFSCAFLSSAPDPHSRQLSPRTRPGSFPPCPPTQLCAQRACSRLPKQQAQLGSLRDSTCTMLRRHALAARPRRRQQLGDQHLREERQDELDAGSDDGSSTDLPSMPPLKPAQREAQCPAARSRSSAPSALSLPLLA